MHFISNTFIATAVLLLVLSSASGSVSALALHPLSPRAVQVYGLVPNKRFEIMVRAKDSQDTGDAPNSNAGAAQKGQDANGQKGQDANGQKGQEANGQNGQDAAAQKSQGAASQKGQDAAAQNGQGNGKGAGAGDKGGAAAAAASSGTVAADAPPLASATQGLTGTAAIDAAANAQNSETSPDLLAAEGDS